MKLNVRLLVAVLLLAGSCFAAPTTDRDGWGDGWGNGWGDNGHHHRRAVPEPGSTIMLTLTAGTLAGGLLLRRRMQGKAVL